MTLQEILTAAGLEPRKYSGRGMGGKDCVGVPESNISKVVSTVFTWMSNRVAEEAGFGGRDADSLKDVFEAIDICAEAFDNCRIDALGHGSIIYWPEVGFEEG